jgi:SAM-dependent methyltransferase
MEQALSASLNVPRELGAFAQESARLWRGHTGLIQVNPNRRDHGVVYTPETLVNTLISIVFSEFPPCDSITVLDPSCGTGNFLVEAYRRLAQNLQLSTVESRIELLRNSVFGCDIDAQAIEVTKRRLWQTALEGAGVWIPFAEFPHSNFVMGDALSLLPADDSRQLFPGTGWSLWLASILQKQFDVIIGNPPYGKIRPSSAQRQYFTPSLYGHANVYGLFLHVGVELLKPNGVLGYVVPASMLSGLYFQNLRKYLSERCRFRAIVQFDERAGIFESVLQEVMLLVVQRGQVTAPYTVRVATVNHKAQIADFSAFSQLFQKVSSEAVLRRSGGYEMIHIPARRGTDAIYNKYEKRGVPLSDATIGYVAKTGPIVWNRLKALLRDEPAENARPLVWANNVSYYRFTANGNREKRLGYLQCTERTLPLLTHGLCLLVQRTTAKEQRRRIVAAFPQGWECATGPFFVENHLNLVVPIRGVTPLPAEYVLALLNSRLFDFIFRTFNGNTQVSVTELNVMRFAVPDTLIINEVARLVGQLQHSKTMGQLTLASELVESLDRIVYDLYELTPDEVQVVERHTRGAVK